MEGLYFHCSLSVCVCVSLCVCVSVCVSVCLSGSACEKASNRTDALIWTRFLLNGCLSQWIEPYLNWYPWVKGQGNSDVIPIFFIILCWFPYFVSQLSYVWSKWNLKCRLDIPLVDLCFNFMKCEWVMTSLWRHFRFLQKIVHISNSHWTYKLRTCNQYNNNIMFN